MYITFCLFENQSYSNLSIDNAATIRKAIPASHMLPVNNQTTNATKAAGISIKSKRMTSIINIPIIINAIIPRISANNGVHSISNLKLEFSKYKFMHKSKRKFPKYYFGV